MADYIDIEIFANRTAAEVRAEMYRIGPQGRRNVQVIEVKRVLLNDSRNGPTRRIFDSAAGTFFIVKSEG